MNIDRMSWFAFIALNACLLIANTRAARGQGLILVWFCEQIERAGGCNYQTVINEVLRQHIQRVREPLEKTLRRVIREEIRRAS
jgi:hypothetical protein